MASISLPRNDQNKKNPMTTSTVPLSDRQLTRRANLSESMFRVIGSASPPADRRVGCVKHAQCALASSLLLVSKAEVLFRYRDGIAALLRGELVSIRAGSVQNQRTQLVLRIAYDVRRIAMLLSLEHPARASRRA